MADCNMVGPDLQPVLRDLQPVLRIRTTFDRIQIRLMGPDPLKQKLNSLNSKFFFLLLHFNLIPIKIFDPHENSAPFRCSV